MAKLTTYRAMSRPLRAVEAGDDWYPDARETLVVIVQDGEPISTGLVDQHGVTIYRCETRAPVGFVSRKGGK